MGRIVLPWTKVRSRIYTRCFHDKSSSYYGRVKANISIAQIKRLWFRDEAYKMARPSIDRIDPRKDYTFDNCRFIELAENLRGKKYKTMGRSK